MGDLTLKKKKKKSTKSLDLNEFEQQLEEAGVEDITESTNGATNDQSAIGLSYPDLLSRFFDILKKNNPELAGDRSGPKFRIPPPIVQEKVPKDIVCQRSRNCYRFTEKSRTFNPIFVCRIGYYWFH